MRKVEPPVKGGTGQLSRSAIGKFFNQSVEPMLLSEDNLMAASLALGARNTGTWSEAEDVIAQRIKGKIDAATVDWLARYIKQGYDPLGESFCNIRDPETRRARGATYTPHQIIQAMVHWAASRGDPPRRVLDPGIGSGRFLVAAGRAFPEAELVGIDIDPLATLIAEPTLPPRVSRTARALCWGIIAILN